MTPEQSEALIKTVERIDTRMEMLIANGGSKGMVPELQRTVLKHANQIAFWRGAIAVLAFLLMFLGTAFAGHIWLGGGH